MRLHPHVFLFYKLPQKQPVETLNKFDLLAAVDA